MGRVSGALLDTSAIIAAKAPGDLPPAAAISVITLGELRAGVRLAGGPALRAAREARLVAIRDAFEPLPVDTVVAERYGEVLAGARAAKRVTTATDLLIVATAAATGRVLFSLDKRQKRLAKTLGIPVA